MLFRYSESLFQGLDQKMIAIAGDEAKDVNKDSPILMRKIYYSRSFALDTAQVKVNV